MSETNFNFTPFYITAWELQCVTIHKEPCYWKARTDLEALYYLWF
jgi:hypothetical protein